MKKALLKSFGLYAPLCFIILFACKASAQTTGTITGQVTDSTGAVIPAAAVTATEVSKGVEFRGRTNAVGEYTIPEVTPGMYKVTASAPGFQTAIALNATLEIGQIAAELHPEAGRGEHYGCRDLGSLHAADAKLGNGGRDADRGHS